MYASMHVWSFSMAKDMMDVNIYFGSQPMHIHISIWHPGLVVNQKGKRAHKIDQDSEDCLRPQQLWLGQSRHSSLDSSPNHS